MPIDWNQGLGEFNLRGEPYIMVGNSEKRKPQIGDVYHIPVRVISTSTLTGCKPYKVEVLGRPDLFEWICGATLDASKLVEAAPRPLKVGDFVQGDTLPKGSYTVVGIHGGRVWVLSPENGYLTRMEFELKRVG